MALGVRQSVAVAHGFIVRRFCDRPAILDPTSVFRLQPHFDCSPQLFGHSDTIALFDTFQSEKLLGVELNRVSFRLHKSRLSRRNFSRQYVYIDLY